MFRRVASLALASALALGCVVVQPRPVAHAGPPPHAPAHGYRANHAGGDLVYDEPLGVYVVVGHPALWFLDGTYFRVVGERWEIATAVAGPWRVARVDAVPVRLYESRHPHGMPPGRAKKLGTGWH